MMYLKSDGSHQTIMIMCGCIWFSFIITLHIMWHLCFLAKVSHATRILFATLDTMYKYNMIWPFKVTLVWVFFFFFFKQNLCFCFKKTWSFEFCIFFFSVCVHSILLSRSSCSSIVPCSPCSLYVSFLSVSDKVFWLSMPFDHRVKGGEIWDLNAIPQGK